MPPADSAALPDPASDGENDGEPKTFSEGTSDDWQKMADGLRKRRLEAKAAKKQAAQAEVDADDFDEEGPLCTRQCCFYFAAVMLALLAVAAYQLWMWFHPQPISCSLELVRPQKFKVDVTEFFAPRVSAAMQLVLQLKNPNLLRSMLLEQCKLTAYDATGLKLGSALQTSLVLSPFSSTQVTVRLNDMGKGLPLPESRRLAASFLAEKALLLTLVATASSRIPKKGSISSTTSTNATRRVELTALTKEPFFQRAPVAEEPPPADADKKPEPADVHNA